MATPYFEVIQLL